MQIEKLNTTKRVALTMLRGSIRKWVHVVDGSGTDEEGRSCACCKTAHKLNKSRVAGPGEVAGYCFFCPIYAAVGATSCAFTPYVEWKKAADKTPSGRDGDLTMSLPKDPEKRVIAVKAAMAELAFLKEVMAAVRAYKEPKLPTPKKKE